MNAAVMYEPWPGRYNKYLGRARELWRRSEIGMGAKSTQRHVDFGVRQPVPCLHVIYRYATIYAIISNN